MPVGHGETEWREENLIAALQDVCLAESCLEACDFSSLLAIFRNIGSFKEQSDTGPPFMRTQRQIVTAKIAPLLERAASLEVERLSRELIRAYERAQVDIAKSVYPVGSEMLAVVEVVTPYGAHFTVDGVEVVVQCISAITPEWHRVIQQLAPGEQTSVVVDQIDEARGRWNVRPARLENLHDS